MFVPMGGMMRWWNERYLMYFFHSKFLFIPVLWKERRIGGRMKTNVRMEKKM